MMNRVTGKVVVQESGAGVPDLLVSVYDVAPDVKPVKTMRSTRAKAVPSELEKQIGRRIGSVLTAGDGAFSLEYPDSAFSPHDAERRPHLVLVIYAPEEPGGDQGPRALHTSSDVRQNAGRLETYLVKLPAVLLKKAGVPIPEAVATSSQAVPSSAEVVIEQTRKQSARREKINEDIRRTRIAKVETARVLARQVKAKFERFHELLSRVPAEVRDSPAYVGPGKGVRNAADWAVKDACERASMHEMTVRLDLTEKQIAEMQLGNTDIGNTSRDKLPPQTAQVLDRLLYGERPDGSRGVVLERLSPADLACRTHAFPEGPCRPDSTLRVPVAGMDGGSGRGSDGEEEEEALAPKFERASLQMLLRAMTPPESPPSMDGANAEGRAAIARRAGTTDVQATVDLLRLRGGPADETAYYDFYELQVAFKEVWQEAFDAGILGTAKGIYSRIVKEGGVPPEPTDSFSLQEYHDRVRDEWATMSSALDEEPQPVIASWFSLSSEQWGALSGDFRSELVSITDDLVRLTALGMWLLPEYAAKQARGLQILAYADRKLASSVGSPHILLEELAERLKAPYTFTYYAANRLDRTVNFGLVLTYRQRWEPLAYQAGRLVKTVPLAPKEVRKYSKKSVTKRSVARKEVENNVRSRRDESTDTSRAESEIVRNAQVKTNFSLSSQGGLKLKVFEASGSAAFSREASTATNEVKKDFREAIFKSAQEYKDEHTLEVNTAASVDTEAEESGEISNPNDEIPVTFLFYELQRRYSVSEQIHRLTPVILVAQEMPRPDEIDEDWLVTHDWILRRVILDDSFLPSLTYLSTRLVGDDAAVEELKKNVELQRETVHWLKEQVVAYRAHTGDRYAALERAIENRAVEAGQEANAGLVARGVGYFMGGGAGGDADEAARIREDAAKDAAERAAREEKDLRDRLDREVTALAVATEGYTKALSEHLNRKAQIARLCVHVKQNILYYMQAIWSYEPPDQRFFRLHKVPVPVLRGTQAARDYRFDRKAVDGVSIGPDVRPAAFYFKVMTALARADETAPLAEVADLDNLLGYKGNYMIFPLRRTNELTDFMAAPYLDPQTCLRDPDENCNWSEAEFARYVCCLKEGRSAKEFDALRPQLQLQYDALLATLRRHDEEVVVPTGSLFIEALPGAHPILEDFKLMHRAVDVKKVQAEVRAAEINNIRAATRLVEGEREDPDIEKKIVVEGPAGLNVITPTDQ